MEQVVRVSIGNTAFTLDKEAYEILSEYLDSFNDYYEGNANAEEIIAGIEERIAELLVDRGFLESVVPESVVEEIISILGRPNDIDGGNEAKPKQKNRKKKRLYRDVDNKIIGGVLSGLSSYLSFDVAWLRIIVLFVFIMCAVFDIAWFDGPFCMLIILAYIVMWISMPAAITSEQKRELRGQESSIGGIQRDVESGKRKRRNVNGGKSSGSEKFLNVLQIIVGILLMIIGASALIGIILFLFGISVFPFFNWGLSRLIAPLSGCAPWVVVMLKITVVLMTTLPFIGILYGGVMMVFRLKSPKWRPGLIIFLVWIFSIIMVGVSSLLTFRTMDYNRRLSDQTLPAQDTLYIDFENCNLYKNDKVILNASQDEYELLYFVDERKNPEIVQYPFIELNKVDFYDKILVQSENVLLRKSVTMDEINALEKNSSYRMEGNRLVVYPTVLNKEADIRTFTPNLQLNVDRNTVVIVSQPMFHEFNREFSYRNFFFGNIDIDED